MTEVKNKFDIGDEVCSKKTGLPGVGTIVGILPLKIAYSGMLGNPEKTCRYWKELHPDFNPESFVYVVSYDEARKNISFAEFSRGMAEEIPEDDSRVLYKYTVANINNILYPEEDLEKFE
jgi:hypothetical protein